MEWCGACGSSVVEFVFNGGIMIITYNNVVSSISIQFLIDEDWRSKMRRQMTDFDGRLD